MDEDGRITDFAEQEKFTDFILEREVGKTGFMGYLSLKAREGFSFSRSGRSTGFMIKDSGAFVYWGLELLGIAIVCALTAVNSAKKPFCSYCKNWYGHSEHIGSFSYTDRAAVLEAVSQGNVERFQSLLQPDGDLPHSLELTVRRCASCVMSEDVLIATHAGPNASGKMESRVLAQAMLPRDWTDKFAAAAAQ